MTKQTTFEVVCAVALANIEYQLQQLINTRCEDDDWDDADVFVDYAVEVALEKTRQLKHNSYSRWLDMQLDWYRVQGVIDCAKKAFSRPDCWYGRAIERLAQCMEAIPEMLEQAEHEGGHDAP